MRELPITLLDEPTNNLDRPTKAVLARMVDDWPGTLLVVSHDLDLLERMDQTAELYSGRLATFGGPYSAWKAALDQQQANAAQAAAAARHAVKAEQRQRAEAESRLAKRARKRREREREQEGLEDP